MDQVVRKPTLTPPEPASDAEFNGQSERLPAEPKVGGSSPLGRATPHPARGFAISTSPKPSEKANAHPLHEAVDAFLLTKQIAGCTSATISTYRWWLQRFTAAVCDATPIAVRQFFAGLQHRSVSHQHQAFRTLRTFFRWCTETGALTDNPLRGFTEVGDRAYSYQGTNQRVYCGSIPGLQYRRISGRYRF